MSICLCIYFIYCPTLETQLDVKTLLLKRLSAPG